jgi:hypothetical protein
MANAMAVAAAMAAAQARLIPKERPLKWKTNYIPEMLTWHCWRIRMLPCDRSAWTAAMYQSGNEASQNKTMLATVFRSLH